MILGNEQSLVMLIVALVFHQLEGIACPDDDFGIHEQDFITVENDREYYNFVTDVRNDFDCPINEFIILLAQYAQHSAVKPVLCAISYELISNAYRRIYWKVSCI